MLILLKAVSAVTKEFLNASNIRTNVSKGCWNFKKKSAKIVICNSFRNPFTYIGTVSFWKLLKGTVSTRLEIRESDVNQKFFGRLCYSRY
jgi:hypothetical protein